MIMISAAKPTLLFLHPLALLLLCYAIVTISTSAGALAATSVDVNDSLGSSTSLAARSLMDPASEVFMTRPSIILRAGVLHAPPFAMVEQDNVTSEYVYGGFQPDLLRSMTVFAAEDGFDLSFKLSPAPPKYGPALDMVANDCNTTAQTHNYTKKQCKMFDLIVGDYYSNPDRSVRVDFTPAWLRTTMSTIKYVDKTSRDFTTLTEAQTAGATVCVPEGTYLMEVVMGKFPGAEYLKCPTQQDCLDELKAENCVLYADDELQLRYRAALDPSLEVTREQFNTQYLVWPMTYKLDSVVAQMMKRWIYAAVSNATADTLYYRYFAKELCPVGTAGEKCELPCDPNHGVADAKGNCVCSSTRYKGDDCSIEVMEDVNLIPVGLKVAGYIMYGINVVICLVCGLWLYSRRETAQVKIAQPLFLAMVLLGCFISSSTIAPLAQEDSGDGPVPSCMLVPWFYSVGFSITFGALFVKIRRVYKLFKAAASFKREIVSMKETLSIVGGVLLLDVSILLVWTIVDPLHWRRETLVEDQFGYPLESEGFCYSEHWRIFGGVIALLHFSLMGVATYMCIVSRNLPQDFSEAKYVAIAMISNLQIFVVGVPVLVLLGSDSDTSFFVRSAIIWMNDIVVVFLIFGNLIYSVEVRHVNSDANVNQVVGNAIKKYTRASQARDSTTSAVQDQRWSSTYSTSDFAARSAGATGKMSRNVSNISLSESSYYERTGHLVALSEEKSNTSSVEKGIVHANNNNIISDNDYGKGSIKMKKRVSFQNMDGTLPTFALEEGSKSFTLEVESKSGNRFSEDSSVGSFHFKDEGKSSEVEQFNDSEVEQFNDHDES